MSLPTKIKQNVLLIRFQKVLLVFAVNRIAFNRNQSTGSLKVKLYWIIKSI